MKVLLVDGYNVLRSGELYAFIDADDHTHDAFNIARQTLVTDVATFAKGSYQATIVFDGASNPESTGAVRDVAGVDVVFSPAGKDADSVIEKLAQDAARAGHEVVVVTSDAHTQWTVFRDRVTRMSAAGFCGEMRAIHRELAESNPQPIVKTTLAARLDSQTRAALEQWARGK
ncbi:MAG: NYN domain-containing protein [Coriobacteriales bacterium]|jgi:predicted RNA-binding protein with PIN domain|nr:NYN domain-containing protein [Coriobacteriales bacterium]